MGARAPFKDEAAIGTQAAPTAVNAGASVLSTVYPTNGADFLRVGCRCTKAHTINVYGGNTSAAPANKTTMKLLRSVSGLAATANYGEGLDPVYLGGYAWVAFEVTNNDGALAADVWGSAALVP